MKIYHENHIVPMISLGYGFVKKSAISHSHIQFNHPSFKRYIVIDADYAGAATAWRYEFAENIPVPNLIVTNPENSHCHFYYELSAPVSFTDSSSKKAQEFYNAVSKKLTEVLRGDTNYTGLIAKTLLMKSGLLKPLELKHTAYMSL